MIDRTLRVLSRGLILAAALFWAGNPAAQESARAGVYADEDKDWGVPARSQLRTVDYHAPTPREIPGGRVVVTGELKQLLEKEPRPFLLDVVGGDFHRTIAGAFWLTGAGAGDMSRDEEKRFSEVLGKFTGGDKGRALVFFCVDSQCWLSHNAATRAGVQYTGS